MKLHGGDAGVHAICDWCGVPGPDVPRGEGDDGHPTVTSGSLALRAALNDGWRRRGHRMACRGCVDRAPTARMIQRVEGRRGCEPARLGDCVVVTETIDAILVRLADGHHRWVPKSVVHDESEVWSHHDEDARGPGTLIVHEWWARSERLVAGPAGAASPTWVVEVGVDDKAREHLKWGGYDGVVSDTSWMCRGSDMWLSYVDGPYGNVAIGTYSTQDDARRVVEVALRRAAGLE